MRVLRQIVRGCGFLPHVGTHPGTPFVVVFLIAGAILAGWHGLLFMSVWLPFYFYGAYERAQLSDRERDKQ